MYIENYEFTQITLIIIQNQGVHFNVLPFQINNSLF